SERRREMMNIIHWRLDQCERLGVDIRYNIWAEAQDVLDFKPDLVVIATGGMPHTEILEAGNDLVVSGWDILSGDVKPGQNVLLFDDAGDHVALQAAEKIAESGASLEIMTPDRSFAPEVMGLNLSPYVKKLQEHDAVFSVTFRLNEVHREGNQLKAVYGSDYTDLTREKLFDQVVVNHGTIPLDELYFDLKELSVNRGELDHQAFIQGREQRISNNENGQFQLFRIGDAVSARNTHAAIYDAMRLMKDN
ncbi:MAG: N-methylproline demethylase, partial [Alphaproteobacteria bacterium]|nr:N-methylproline demethylase [Alphaproteobacteria bacterium]